jgi:hypothetical protein
LIKHLKINKNTVMRVTDRKLAKKKLAAVSLCKQNKEISQVHLLTTIINISFTLVLISLFFILMIIISYFLLLHFPPNKNNKNQNQTYFVTEMKPMIFCSLSYSRRYLLKVFGHVIIISLAKA